MKKYIWALMLCFTALPVMACQINGSDLTDLMKQELIVKCEQMKLDEKSKPAEVKQPVVTKEVVSEWAAISEQFARALGVAATEVGISVNEFLKTPAGILTATTLIIVTVGNIFLGSVIGIVFMFIVGKLNRRVWMKGVERVEYEGFFSKRAHKEVIRYKTFDEMTENGLATSICSILALAAYWAILIWIIS